MIIRKIYTAQIKNDMLFEAINVFKESITHTKKYINERKILTISLFNDDNNLFLYYECIEEEIEPSEIFNLYTNYLEKWIGEKEYRYWVPMIDIFHNNEPESLEQWERQKSPEQLIGNIAKLRPDKVSSYIFYHYQLQEEKLGYNHKYGIIGLCGNTIFFYKEKPFYIDKAPRKGKLTTSNTPYNWGELMQSHFVPWEHSTQNQSCWKDTELIFSLFYDKKK